MMIHNKAPEGQATEVAFLLVMGALVGNQINFQVEKYDASNQKFYPTIQAYLRATFPEVVYPTTMGALAVLRAGNDIASKSRRGSGNYLLIHPESDFDLESLPTTNPGIKIEKADWLEKDEVFVCYASQANPLLDSGFVWQDEPDGTISVSAVPTVADYGRFVKLA